MHLTYVHCDEVFINAGIIKVFGYVFIVSVRALPGVTMISPHLHFAVLVANL